MGRHHRAVWAMLLAVAGMATVPATAQDQVAQEASAPDGAPAGEAASAADGQEPLQASLQAGQTSARARTSMAEKAAAVVGAVAAGAVALKGLSALFKSGKGKAASTTPTVSAPID